MRRWRRSNYLPSSAIRRRKGGTSEVSSGNGGDRLLRRRQECSGAGGSNAILIPHGSHSDNDHTKVLSVKQQSIDWRWQPGVVITAMPDHDGNN